MNYCYVAVTLHQSQNIRKSSEINAKHHSLRLGPTSGASACCNLHGTHAWEGDRGGLLLPAELQHAWHTLGCDRVLQTVVVLGASDNDPTVRCAALGGLKYAWRVDPFLVVPGFSSIEFRDEALRCLSAALTASSVETRRNAITVVARCASLNHSNHAIYVLLKQEVSAITQLFDMAYEDSEALREHALLLTDALRTAQKLLAPMMPSILQPLSRELQRYCMWPSPSSATQPSSSSSRIILPRSSIYLAVKSSWNRKGFQPIDEGMLRARLSSDSRGVAADVPPLMSCFELFAFHVLCCFF